MRVGDAGAVYLWARLDLGVLVQDAIGLCKVKSLGEGQCGRCLLQGVSYYYTHDVYDTLT